MYILAYQYGEFLYLKFKEDVFKLVMFNACSWNFEHFSGTVSGGLQMQHMDRSWFWLFSDNFTKSTVKLILQTTDVLFLILLPYFELFQMFPRTISWKPKFTTTKAGLILTLCLQTGPFFNLFDACSPKPTM